jgi:The GLUG motif
VAILLTTSSAFGAYSGGTGDPNTPYQITTKADLLALAANTADYGKCFILTADIDLDPNLPGGQVFTAAIIAADTNSSGSHHAFQGIAFTGTFDGNGNKISGFVINGGSNSYLGLFGQINTGGLIKNLGLENCSVSGHDDVGGLVGENYNGSISNCYSTGAVSGHGYGAGGLVGENSGSISNCYSTGAVSGGYNVGGLVGDNYGGSISNCYSMGAGYVSGLTCVGGLVGRNEYDGSIGNCYSTHAVGGSEEVAKAVGGLVGGSYSGSISNCYSTGAVSGGYNVGGLVGYNNEDGIISNCYSTGTVGPFAQNYFESGIGGLVGQGGNIVSSFWDIETSGTTVGVGHGFGSGVSGKTTAQMKTRSTFTSAGWDFTTIWAISEGTSYPWLIWQIPPAVPATITIATPAQHQIDATNEYKPPIAATGDVAVHADHLRLWNSSSGKWLSNSDVNYQTKLNALSGSGKSVVVITHGWHDGIDQSSWTSNLAALLHAQDGTVAILAWDWRNLANPSGTADPLIDISNSGLMMAAASASCGAQTGKLLAQDLLALKIDSNQTQLIGHSNGGAVIGSAAHVLAQQDSMHVKRLTTLDTPDLSLTEIITADFLGLFTFDWFSWQLYTSVHATDYIDNRDVQQVDAYFSDGLDGRNAFGFGSPLANHGVDNVFNGKLATDGSLFDGIWENADHIRARVWYTRNDPSNPNVAGASWSILNQTNGWHSGNYDETGYNTGAFPNDPPVASPVWVYRPLTCLTFDQAETWQGQHATITDTGLEAHGFACRIQTGSDGYLFKDINIPTDAEYLTFDYLVESPGAYLTLQFGDNVILYQDLTSPTDWITTEHLYVGLWAGQTDTLLFTLHQASDTNSSLLVDNITFSTVNTPPPTYEFGSFDGKKNVKLMLKDCDGNNVTFSLTGGGYGEVNDCSFSTITLYDTTEKSTFTIKSKTETSVGDINVNGPLKAISATNIELHGSITIGSSSNHKAAVMIGFDRASDLAINSQMPINSISATEWLGGSINAPSIGSITTKGDKKRSITGDLDVNVILNGSINSVKVAGTLSGDWTCDSIKGISATDIVEANLILSQQPDSKVKVLALGSLIAKGWIDSSQILSTGNIGTVTAGAIIDSNCFAGVAEGITGLPAAETASFSETATIKSVAVKGIKGVSKPYYINSNIAAVNILSASIAYPQSDNGGVPFGLTADNIKKLTIKKTDGTTASLKNLGNSTDSQTIDGVEIRLY